MDTPNEVQIDQLEELDLSNVDTSRPLITGPQRVRIVKMEVVKSKNGDWKNLNVVLGLVNGTKTKDGKEVNPGFQHTETITLKRTEKYEPTENLARLQECFLGKKGRWNSSEMYGAEGDVRFDIQPAEGQYPESSRVVGWIKKKLTEPAPLS